MEITDWDDYYKENKVAQMPWYHTDLDHDLENEIKSRNIHTGKFLDLGTGPGTQACRALRRHKKRSVLHAGWYSGVAPIPSVDRY